MDAAELAMWEAEYQIEPWGERRSDLHAAICASASFNAMGGKTRPKDFLPQWEEKRQTPQEMILVGMAFAAGTKGR